MNAHELLFTGALAPPSGRTWQKCFMTARRRLLGPVMQGKAQVMLYSLSSDGETSVSVRDKSNLQAETAQPFSVCRYVQLCFSYNMSTFPRGRLFLWFTYSSANQQHSEGCRRLVVNVSMNMAVGSFFMSALVPLNNMCVCRRLFF